MGIKKSKLIAYAFFSALVTKKSEIPIKDVLYKKIYIKNKQTKTKNEI